MSMIMAATSLIEVPGSRFKVPRSDPLPLNLEPGTLTDDGDDLQLQERTPLKVGLERVARGPVVVVGEHLEQLAIDVLAMGQILEINGDVAHVVGAAASG